MTTPWHLTFTVVKLLNSKDEVAVFSAKRWDRRNRALLFESEIPCHDTRARGNAYSFVS